MTVTNAAGSVMRQWQATLLRGANTLTWNLQNERKTDVPAGAYHVEARLGTHRTSARLTMRRSEK
jgi:flagellar hook assembly protein FlgD